jgi:hypothetical protein
VKPGMNSAWQIGQNKSLAPSISTEDSVRVRRARGPCTGCAGRSDLVASLRLYYNRGGGGGGGGPPPPPGVGHNTPPGRRLWRRPPRR